MCVHVEQQSRSKYTTRHRVGRSGGYIMGQASQVMGLSTPAIVYVHG